MLKALSFLGIGKYKAVNYVWEGNRCNTHLFPEALVRLFVPDEVIVFVTEKSRQAVDENGDKYVDYLKNTLGDKVKFVDIPEGRTEEELWQIFEICGDQVGEEDEIIIDITHSFRSIPMFVLAAALYLRRVKGNRIARIVYGAYEARQNNDAPVFDLTALLDLIEWLSGADAFVLRGDATGFAQKLRETHRSLGRQGIRTSLSEIAGKLEALSLAVSLARPCESLKTACETVSVINKVVDDVSKWAKPFTHILEMIGDEMSHFSYANSEELTAQNLLAQFELIKYMLSKKRYMQAVTLAREWIVSWVLFKKKEKVLRDRGKREEAEKALGALAASKRERDKPNVPDWMTAINAELLKKSNFDLGVLWNNISLLRNDVDHCGMRKDAFSINRIVRRAANLSQDLEVLVRDVESAM